MAAILVTAGAVSQPCDGGLSPSTPPSPDPVTVHADRDGIAPRPQARDPRSTGRSSCRPTRSPDATASPSRRPRGRSSTSPPKPRYRAARAGPRAGPPQEPRHAAPSSTPSLPVIPGVPESRPSRALLDGPSSRSSPVRRPERRLLEAFRRADLPEPETNAPAPRSTSSSEHARRSRGRRRAVPSARPDRGAMRPRVGCRTPASRSGGPTRHRRAAARWSLALLAELDALDHLRLDRAVAGAGRRRPRSRRPRPCRR